MKSMVLVLSLLAVSAGAAAAQTYWEGASNPAGTAIINVDAIEIAGDKRTAAISLILPKDAQIGGKPVAVLITRQEFDCVAHTSRSLGLAVYSETAEMVVSSDQVQAEGAPIEEGSAGWTNMQIICSAPESRGAFGKSLAGQPFRDIMNRVRSAPAATATPGLP
ncbi:MAG: hypothetical protein U1E50_01680 [Caulobacteraceae bacterium]